MYPNRYISQDAAVVILEHPPPSIFELVFSTTPRFQIFKKLKRNLRAPTAMTVSRRLAAEAAANGASHPLSFIWNAFRCCLRFHYYV